MKNAVLTTAITLALAGTAAAQAGGGPSAVETSAPQNAQSGIVTAIGCVQAGTSASEGEARPGGAQGAAFLLINAALSGSAAAAGAPPATTTFMLDGHDLSPYVGHTVQVMATKGDTAGIGAESNSRLQVTWAVRLGTSCSLQASR